eukprot:TRINITY_DN6642_c0_g2_i3.p1 TRINITY_DN6642_c0_g2~~TRINITY_DN6642_c0_g2_i3.p1  ORF type:complete len:643 (+),score=103.04 TRINITY_DN6642_c0_g2_i3:27-1931(+)
MLEIGEELRKSLLGAGRSHSTAASVPFKLIPQDDNNTTSNNSAVVMSLTVLVAFVFIVLLAVIVFIISTVGTQLSTSTINKYHDCGKARTLAQIAAREVLHIDKIKRSGHIGSLAQHTDLLHETLDSFTAVHNKLTVGKSPSRYSELVSHFKDPHYLVSGCTGKCWIPVSLWSLGLEIIGSLTSVSMIDVNGSGMERDFRFLDENVPTVASWAYNDTIALYRDEHIENQAWVIAGMSFVLFLVFFLAMTVKNLFELNFKKIGVNKIVAIHLFSLIPHSTQEQLHLAVKEKMKEFDRTARDEEKPDDSGFVITENFEEEEEDLRRGTAFSVSQKNLGHSIGRSGGKPLVSALAKPWHERKRDKRRKMKHVTFNLVGVESEPMKPMTKLVEPEISVDDLAAVVLSPEERLELISDDEEETVDPMSEVQTSRVSSEDKTSSHNLVVTIWVAAVGFLFLVALGVEAYFVYRYFHTVEDHRTSLEFVTVSQEFLGYCNDLNRYAVEFASTGKTHPYWSQYWLTVKGTKFKESRRHFSRKLVGDELGQFGSIIDLLNRVHSTERIALSIAARGWKTDTNLLGDVQDLTWSPAPQPKSSFQLRNKNYGYTSSEQDLSVNRSRDEQIKQAQLILSSERFVIY